MTQSQTPNTQNQAKPNNLSAIDKKIADGKAAEQQPAEQQPAMQAPGQAQMQAQADGKPVQPDSDKPAPAQQGDTGTTKN